LTLKTTEDAVQLSDGTNTIDERRFEIVADQLAEDQFYEFEDANNGNGYNEVSPTQLDRRHSEQWQELANRYRLLSVVQWVKLYPYSL
jgi:hypothetical protein